MFKNLDAKSWSLIILRSILGCSLLLLLDALLGLDTSLLLISCAITIGTIFGSYLSKINFRLSALIVLSIIGLLLFKFSYFLLDVLLAPTNTVFLIYNTYQHTLLIFSFFLLAKFTTFLFWNFRKYITLEFIVILLSVISIFSLHRNYRFDLLRYINDISWDTGLSQLAVLTLISSLIFFSSFIYLYIANSLPIETINGEKILINSKSTNFYNLKSYIIILLISLFLSLISREVYKYHFKNSETLLQNGVGSNAEEGLSPLDFKSALGSSNQPAAVVRLNSDYLKNPLSPMLYLRESALSEISNNKMVLANTKYDLDITRSSPYETYVRGESLNKNLREKLNYSIYLLGNHKVAFGVDYPVLINPIKIPKDKKKFKAGYSATSLAPVFNKKILTYSDVFNKNWDQKTKNHYLKTHHDVRYKNLATKLTSGISSPVKKVRAIIEHLNKNAIYTLAPNHEVGDEIDPSASFLFGDLRGYCVHFAHATVYMFRALGIPSRIATGYLTDLSQAKDGHILLRMSDRHAWAEIYISKIGWVPFDVEPEQVESHAETPVDQNLLDELIDLIGTDEEIISNESLKGEIEEDTSIKLITIKVLKKIAIFLLIIITLIYLRKFYLYYSWKLTSDNNKKLKKLYIATLATLEDIGFSKKPGETKQEFLTRASKSHKINHNDFLTALNMAIYNNNSSGKALLDYKNFISNLSYKQKLLYAINPSSVFMGVGLWKF